MSRQSLAWWETACELAEVAPGGAYHTLRRTFATERTGVALKTLAVLGGWKDTRTLCYQHPDMGQLREALEEPRRKVTGT